MDFLINRLDINKDKIVVFGRLLGGVVVVWFVSSKKYFLYIVVLVLENIFILFLDIVKLIFVDLFILEYIFVFLFKNKVRCISIYLYVFGVKVMLIMLKDFIYICLG